jgi:hypothetical protein
MSELSKEEQQKINEAIASYDGYAKTKGKKELKRETIEVDIWVKDRGFWIERREKPLDYCDNWGILVRLWAKCHNELLTTKTVDGGKLEYFTFHFMQCVNTNDVPGAAQLLSSAITYLKTHTINIHE